MKSLLLLLLALAALTAAWTKEDHEIFRLKDELEHHEGANVTFYDFLRITPSASQEDIGRALRKLAKSMHPDKAKQAFLAEHATSASAHARSSYRSATSSAKAAGKPTTGIKPPKPSSRASRAPSDREIRAATKRATERFTRMGIIGDILKGAGRERYDHFLRNGFPAWRGTGWYYERYRPGLGSVLLGLFVFAGGAVHYAVLTLSFNRRRAFVARYIAHARTMAWGDASALGGIPGITNAGETASASSTAVPQPAEDDAGLVQTMNRRERRAQEKSSKKPSAKNRRAATSAKESGTSTPQNEPAGFDPSVPLGEAAPAPGPKKRVLAQNGKVLVVDSTGSVFLEEMVKEDEDDSEDEGTPQLFLLDPDAERRPGIKDTMVWRLPLWTYAKAKEGFTGLLQGKSDGAGGEAENDQAKRRRKTPLKPKPGQFGEKVDEAVATALGVAKDATPVSAEAPDEEVDGFVAVAELAKHEADAAVPDTTAASARKRKGKIRK